MGARGGDVRAGDANRQAQRVPARNVGETGHVFTPLLAPAGQDHRHVVFADDLLRRGLRRAVNFAPRGADADAADALHDPSHRRGGARLAPDEAEFVRWLFSRAGLDAADYREETLIRRLPACLRAVRAGSVDRARQSLGKNPRLLPVAIDAILIGVTSFFRDRAVFDAIASDVMPALADAPGGAVRIWSAGCSDGAELYSLAMLLDEASLLDRANLLGTDCRTSATRQAALGIFGDAAVRALPREQLERYFVPEPVGVNVGRTNGASARMWRVRHGLRTRIRWRTADVLRVDEPGQWDLILCRNLVMYLRPRLTAALLARLCRALSPGGFLVLGKAERPTGLPLRSVSSCIYRREGGCNA